MGRINFLRGLRVVMMLNIAIGTIDVIVGAAVAFVTAGTVLLLLGVIGFQTHVIRRMEKQAGCKGSLPVAVLRHIARRPRKTMTPEDYQQLREMERELGFEPSDVPVPAPSAAEAEQAARNMQAALRKYASEPVPVMAQDPGTCMREQAEHLRRQIIFSYGVPPARVINAGERLAAEDLLANAAEGAVHFAQLARVGRESCVSPCRLCEARDRHYPTPEDRAVLAAKLAAFEDDASLRDWIENGRWTS